MPDAINALENKTILTTSNFHLSLAEFFQYHPKPISLIAHWPSSFNDPVSLAVTSFSCIFIGPQDSWLIMNLLLLIIIPSCNLTCFAMTKSPTILIKPCSTLLYIISPFCIITMLIFHYIFVLIFTCFV